MAEDPIFVCLVHSNQEIPELIHIQTDSSPEPENTKSFVRRGADGEVRIALSLHSRKIRVRTEQMTRLKRNNKAFGKVTRYLLS